jgi:hypothetical protein
MINQNNHRKYMPELCDYIKLDEAILQIVENDGEDFNRIKQVLISKGKLLTPPQYDPLADSGNFINFVSQLYLYQNSSEYEYSYEGIVRAANVSEEDLSCNWPDCRQLGTDKDHIFPKSTLKKSPLMRLIQSKKRGRDVKTEWDRFNSAWLCSRHNKNVKNDSIGIGIWLMASLER